MVLLASGPKDSVRKADRGKDRQHGRLRADKRGSQASSPRRRTELPQGTKKKPSLATLVASSGKGRPDRLGPSPTHGDTPQLPNRTGRKTPPGKLAERKTRSLDEGASQATRKLQARALSHAELFGDESEDEDAGSRTPGLQPSAPPSFSSSSASDDSDSSLGLSATRGPHKRLRASPPPSASAGQAAQASPSSSSSSSVGAGTDVDYSALEREVDFDSDPMEECLRIFNESTCVKTEDRGRLARQPPKEEKAEDREPSGLTTLFPGQKRRVSHLSKHGKGVSAHAAVRDPRLRNQSCGFLQQTRVQHSLCSGREVPGVHIHSSPSCAPC